MITSRLTRAIEILDLLMASVRPLKIEAVGIVDPTYQHIGSTAGLESVIAAPAQEGLIAITSKSPWRVPTMVMSASPICPR